MRASLGFDEQESCCFYEMGLKHLQSYDDRKKKHSKQQKTAIKRKDNLTEKLDNYKRIYLRAC